MSNNKKIQNAINVVNGLDTLTKGEHDAIIEALTSNTPWYVKILKVLKILGALAGYFLAGLGLSSCTGSLLGPSDESEWHVIGYGVECGELLHVSITDGVDTIFVDNF